MFTKTEIDLIVTSQLESLLWSAGEDYDESGEYVGDMWDEHYSAIDATPELRAKLTEELDQCEPDSELLWATDIYIDNFGSNWPGQFGHDLALTRNGHGAGFWDRGLGDAGDVLTDWAESLCTLNVFHGHDSIHPEWNGMFHAE